MIDATFYSDINITARLKDYGNLVEFIITGMSDEERSTIIEARLFKDTAYQLVNVLSDTTNPQHLEFGEKVTETEYGMVPSEMHKDPRVISKTVGDLIKQLQRLPRSMPLSAFEDEGYAPLVHNHKNPPTFVVIDTYCDAEIDYPVTIDDDNSSFDIWED
jgi:hypothetical protein